MFISNTLNFDYKIIYTRLFNYRTLVGQNLPRQGKDKSLCYICSVYSISTQ